MKRVQEIRRFGGVNTADWPDTIPADQLSEGLNVWNAKGGLHQRPAFRALGDAIGTALTGVSETSVFHHTLPNGVCPYTAISAVCLTTAAATALIPVLWDASGEPETLAALSVANEPMTVDNVCFWRDTPLHGSGIFLVAAAHGQDAAKRVAFFEIGATFHNALSIEPSEFYRPVILRYGMGNAGYTYYDVNQIEFDGPEQPEEPNLLTGGRAAWFTTDGYSSRFVLPDHTLPQDTALQVTLQRSVDPAEDVQLDIAAGQDRSAAVTLEEQSVRLYLDRSTGTLQFRCGDQPFIVPHYRVHNALRVSYDLYDDADAYAVAASPSGELAFAGRTFRVGSGSLSNRILYTEKDKPFYYHLSASFEVGGRDDALTALARQSRYFFAFKSHEIYRLTITGSKGYDRDKPLRDNTPLEIPTIAWQMTTVHSSIGCDRPRSLAFCANRLVWYHSDGNVYTLYGSNGYTEGSVYALGIDLRDRLADLTDPISGAYHNGYYYLASGRHIYVMDASVSGFRYLSGYKSPAGGNGGLCWYVWETPGDTQLALIASGEGQPVWFLQGATGVTTGVFDETQDRDTGPQEDRPIPFACTTALWAGTPDRPERIGLVLDNAWPVSVLLTDGQKTGRTYTAAPAQRPVLCELRPGPVRLPCFGLHLSGQGGFHLHRIGVTYKGT